MFRIGEFARLARVSVKTLHHYDDVGLFRPAATDPETGYRLYALRQLPELHRLLALRDLGFSLAEVAGLRGGPPEVLEARLLARQRELEAEVQRAADRLREISIRLIQLRQEGTMPTDPFTLVSVPAVRIASARELVSAPEQMRERCMALMDRVTRALQATGLRAGRPDLALYHPSDAGIDVEMAVPVDTPIATPLTEGVTVRDLPAAEVARALYHGSYDDFAAVGRLHGELQAWLAARNYVQADACREWYTQLPTRGRREGVMELHYPIRR